MSAPATDTRPWYRQFWPWLLIALPATSVVFSFATLYVAIVHADRVVPHEGDSTSYSAPHESRASRAAAPDRLALEAGDEAGNEVGMPRGPSTEQAGR